MKTKTADNLFMHASRQRLEKEQPLAARMRPRTLDEFIGQDHILAPGRLLRRAIQADRLSSLIFYGPPGTGKTTLASVIANTTKSTFVILNAVLTGVADLRKVTEAAQRDYAEFAQRTILFVDEVHRWNKAQQDALLPWVENGTIILIGATTENPYFTVNRALVSRSRIFQLKPLESADLRQVVTAALSDPDRGYGRLPVDLDEKAMQHLVEVANGDARAALNAVELAVETTQPGPGGRIHISLAVAEESIQKRAVLYDKEGDYHFDIISAFIKSLRGSDPDAALYWLAKMVYAGEDPRFLFRRMLIFAGEDIGLADPQALVVATAAADAFDRVGMPEGRYHLGAAALYLATAPKSNSVMAFFDALDAVEKEGEGEVPNHLRDASRDKEGFGHGAGYLYPHAYRDHWTAQQYLPAHLQGRVFYQPGRLGYEEKIAVDVAKRREAQLAAMLSDDTVDAPPEILSHSPVDHRSDNWLARTMSGASEHLAELRQRMFEAAECRRHDVVLDLNADDGLLLWQAVREAVEGGVIGLTSSIEKKRMLEQQAGALPELRTPQILVGQLDRLGDVLAECGLQDYRFDRILGRNVIGGWPDRRGRLQALLALLQPEGRMVLGEAVLQRTQRLYALLPTSSLDPELASRLAAAEEHIYHSTEDTLINWNEDVLELLALEAGFSAAHTFCFSQISEQWIRAEQLDRWFAGGVGDRPSYAEHLRRVLTEAEVSRIADVFRENLRERRVKWCSERLVLVASAGKRQNQ